MSTYLVAALYRFTALPDHAELREPLLAACLEHGVTGTLLLAGEGINGTFAGTAKGVRSMLEVLRSDPRLDDLEVKESWADELPFRRMKVRIKKEIVTMGVENIDPNRVVGTYVAPENWNALIEDPDVIVIDTRNDYEVGIGSFKGAIDPDIESFREFPEWLRGEVAGRTDVKVAMFCTGGIRCEKSTAFLKQEGVDEVFHLKGGILKYLEVVPEADSLWEGECFVFDERVSVGHGLKPGPYGMCRACGFPIDAAGREHAGYEVGVACGHCHETTNEEQKTRFRERAKQIVLAQARGEEHLSSDACLS